MSQEQHLDEYLKGALAGKFIDSVGRQVECQTVFSTHETGDVLQLKAPEHLSTSSRLDLCVCVRNFLQRKTCGTLLLRGEDVSRGATYEFEAPVRFDADGPACCIAFNWKAPSYATRVKWSASVHLENQMGLSMPVCSGTTVVSAADE